MKKSAVLLVLMSMLSFAFAQVTFDVNPVIVKADNFYDYQIGGYNGFAIEKDQTSGNLFMTYMYQSSLTAPRKQRYAYVSAQGLVLHEGALTYSDEYEGIGSLAIDQSSGAAFFVWHKRNAGDTQSNVLITLVNPNVVNSFENVLVFPSADGQFYLSPVVYIGTSPFENKRRIHVFAYRNVQNELGVCRIHYAYADFDDSLFEDSTLDLEWHYAEFPYFTSATNSLAVVRPYPT
ncbi:MAG TPA: hypothetical protein PKJ08_11395, partial [Candidatus Cloacimonadota bacterium]|nr:hypothetical protein [Candidatus Cloacimonadota bacterium]